MTRSRFQTTSPAACPKPSWLATPKILWAPWRRSGAQLDEAKADATMLAIKEQEDAGIDIVTDGEQSRQHFVHGFLEQIEGIDFAQQGQDGHPQQSLCREVPTVTGALRLRGRGASGLRRACPRPYQP